jgi:hypothetical protein
MSYRIVYPVSMPIEGSSFSDAVKNYIKMNREMNIRQIMLTDQFKHMQANINYGYRDNGRKKASIQLLPINPSVIPPLPSMVGFSSKNPNTPYPAFALGPTTIGAPATIVAPAPMMVASPLGVPGMIYGARKEEKTTATGTPATETTFGPVGMIGPNRQILPIRPVNPIGTDGKPISGMPVPFGVGVGVAASGRPVPFVGGPSPVPGGLMVGAPVRFGLGL